MKVGDKVTISGQEFNVLFVYEDYVLVSMDNTDPDLLAASILVFKMNENKVLTLIKDKKQIKLVITKLFEAVQGQK